MLNTPLITHSNYFSTCSARFI